MDTKKIKNNIGKIIAYTYHQKESPCVIYLHGLQSSRQSEKGKRLELFCEQNGYSFLSVDYTGHGNSEGEIIDFRIKQCLDDVLCVLKEEKIKQPLYLIGSSLGGWIAFLLAEHFKTQVKGILTCAAGVDFLPMIWNHLLTDELREMLKNGGTLGPSEETYGHCFTYPMFTEAEPYLLLNRKIQYDGPVILVHGDKDTIVPYQNSFKIKEALESNKVCVQIIKGEGHILSSFPLEKTLKLMIEWESI